MCQDFGDTLRDICRMNEDPKDTLEVVTIFVCTLQNDADANDTFLAFEP